MDDFSFNDSAPLADLLGHSARSSSRTPLKDLHHNILHKSPYHSAYKEKSTLLSPKFSSYSQINTNAIATTTSSSSTELMQARIEHLERERVDLSIKLHQKDERDRTYKIKIEQLESQLKLAESQKVELQHIFDNGKLELVTLQTQKNEVEEELKKQSKTSQTASDRLWSKITAASRDNAKLKEENDLLQKQVSSAQDEATLLNQKVEALRAEKVTHEELLEKLKFDVVQLEDLKIQVEELQSSNDNLRCEISMLNELNINNANEFQYEKTKYELQIQSLDNDVEMLKKQVQDHEERRRKIEIELNGEQSEDSSNVDSFASNSIIFDLKQKLKDSEAKRRKLHNMLQDLKGNIRVFVRCRPFLRIDNESSQSNNPNISGCVKFGIDGTSVSLTGACKGTGQTFSFDHIFNSKASQNDIYNEVSELVQSAIDGYKCCIFSYGQTGSGKTFSLFGERTGELRGIIPRAIETILEQIALRRTEGWEMSATISMVEIYNEELRDLLGNSNDKGDKIKISNIQGKVFVQGLQSVELKTNDMYAGLSQLNTLLDQSSKLRTTACTSMNEYSSRSHLLFMVDIQGQNISDPNLIIRGGLRLCDLAGSERLDRTGTLNDATRLKETVNINKSLSSLADVFIALSNKASHIPYRNSKLTMLLQDCLSNDGKALMFVNISPTIASSQETLCSLRFASQVSQVELGKAQKQIFALPPASQSLSYSSSNANTSIPSTGFSKKPSRVSAVSNGVSSIPSNTSTSMSSTTGLLSTAIEAIKEEEEEEESEGETMIPFQPSLKSSLKSSNSNKASFNVSFNVSDDLQLQPGFAMGISHSSENNHGYMRSTKTRESILPSSNKKRSASTMQSSHLLQSTSNGMMNSLMLSSSKQLSQSFINSNNILNRMDTTLDSQPLKRHRQSIAPNLTSKWR